MAHFARAVRTGLMLAALVLPAACGKSGNEPADISAASVHHTVAALARQPHWKPGKCLCVGQYERDAIKDYPAGLMADEFARHPWVHNWSECAPLYSHRKSLKLCPGGMADYICSVVEKPDLPAGTTRVVCFHNAKRALLSDEFDVTRNGGGLIAAPVSLKAYTRLTTIESGEEHFE